MDTKERKNIRPDGLRGRQVLDSKTRIPETVHSLVQRTALLEWTKTHGETARITVLHGGAGFGKTVFMAEMAKQYEDRSIWYQIDTFDNDPAYFLQGLNYGLSRLLGTREPALFENCDTGLTKDHLGRAVFALAQMLSEVSVDSLYLMLDDFHKITEEAVFEVIETLLDYTPSKIRICLTVKGSFPQFLASHMLKGEMLQIEASQLHFTREEIKELLSGVTRQEIGDQVLENIMGYTEGWPAGVMFAGLVLKHESTQQDAHSIILHSRMFDYIDYEIFRKLPYDMQCFLADTSALQSLNPALCDYVTERTDSGGILDYLAAESMFVYKFTGNKKWYRYHSIFRDFLKSKLTEARKKEVLERAARYSLRMGEVEQAVQYSISGRVYDVAEAAVEREVIRFIQEGKLTTVKAWVQFLEPERHRLGARCLYGMSRYFSASQNLEQTAEYLKCAIEKAYEDEDYERCGEYGMEYLLCVTRLFGLVRGEYEACEMEKRLQGKKCSRYVELLIRILELKLQLRDRDGLEQFLQKCVPGVGKVHLTMIRNVTAWALEIFDKTEGWGNTLEETRMYARVSPVFGEYGCFTFGWHLYLKEADGYEAVMKEGMTFGGGSIFHQWMQQLLVLKEYRKASCDREMARQTLQEIMGSVHSQGMEPPALLEHDQRLLMQILEEDSGNVEEEVPETKKGQIKVTCLGGFLVEAEGKPLAWRTKKTKELFALLFDREGKGIDKRGLIFRLWPEMPEKRSSTLFNTTMSYLRKTLSGAGGTEVLRVKDKQYAFDMSLIESDCENLEQQVQLVRENRLSGSEEIQSFLDLYKGDYFGGEDYLWLMERRESTEQMFLQAARMLVKSRAKTGDYEGAAMILRKVLSIEEGSSDTLRELLAYRVAAGDLCGARRQYEKIQKTQGEEWDQELEEDFMEFLNRRKEE